VQNWVTREVTGPVQFPQNLDAANWTMMHNPMDRLRNPRIVSLSAHWDTNSGIMKSHVADLVTRISVVQKCKCCERCDPPPERELYASREQRSR
jgi:hypothetical protein